MSVWFDCVLETEGIDMSELLGDLVKKRAISRYDRSYKVDTRTKMSLDLADFGMNRPVEKHKTKDFGIWEKDVDREEKIQRREAMGLTFTGFEEGYATFEKEWDEPVRRTLNLEPVTFGGQGRFLSWGGNYRYCDVIDIAVSKKFPDRVFHYVCWCEGDKIDEYDIQNGKVIKS